MVPGKGISLSIDVSVQGRSAMNASTAENLSASHIELMPFASRVPFSQFVVISDPLSDNDPERPRAPESFLYTLNLSLEQPINQTFRSIRGNGFAINNKRKHIYLQKETEKFVSTTACVETRVQYGRTIMTKISSLFQRCLAEYLTHENSDCNICRRQSDIGDLAEDLTLSKIP